MDDLVYTPVVLSEKEQDFLAFQRDLVQKICQIYQIPSSLLGMWTPGDKQYVAWRQAKRKQRRKERKRR